MSAVISQREMRNSSSEVLRRVEAGEELTVTNHGRPVARLVPIRPSVLDELLAEAAGTLAPLRSQDAIHPAVALRLGVQEMITYDRELADAATRAGLRVLSPGARDPR
ncbi:type II toxin-antitoxin system prevent-host-death family antitoxin [Microbacterium hydrocarbonoxydans]|uniref:type II toxin-antitoxin system prevent-host-death family antitoxin n=1 Tax=Microbacterium hydrocarbonoxydans TaxID=273678 RepID=UPI0020404F1D|nr:type II toxin-antitoxin system prevent-host-death family antitoxin [Microbacterium hydrocarbonoxydans]MCM3780029.1 type II toxin-antitoxin system prevent-host-death family antitoxin [Microbacterium hydrocarbonoxydans]